MLEVSVAYGLCWERNLPLQFLDVMTPLSGYYDGQESTLAEAAAAGYQTVQTDVTTGLSCFTSPPSHHEQSVRLPLPGPAGGGGPLRPGGHGGPAALEPGAKAEILERWQ